MATTREQLQEYEERLEAFKTERAAKEKELGDIWKSYDAEYKAVMDRYYAARDSGDTQARLAARDERRIIEKKRDQASSRYHSVLDATQRMRRDLEKERDVLRTTRRGEMKEDLTASGQSTKVIDDYEAQLAAKTAPGETDVPVISDIEGQGERSLQQGEMTAAQMAQKAIDGGIENVQDQAWWANNPNKQAAWDLIQGGTVQPTAGSQGAITAGQTGATGTVAGSTTGTAGAAGATGATNVDAAMQSIMDDPRIPDDLKPLFQRVVEGWDSTQELNIDNVMTSFNDIMSTTIDPYFKEQIQQFTNDIQDTLKYQAQTGQLEQEQMRTAAGENIRQAQGNLETRGMTFTGEGVRQLGAESAFAQQGKGNIPGQTAFAGGYVEGKVPQANRLMMTSTGLRQQKAMQQIARQAEKTLGSTGVTKLGIPGVEAKGDVTQGSIEQQRQTAAAGTLDKIYSQQQQLNTYDEPQKMFQ